METINSIFENYGGQQIGSIFKKYFNLSLFLKQLMFSFFVISADPPAKEIITWEDSPVISKSVEAEFSEKELNWIETLQLMLTLSQLETEPVAPKEKPIH